MIYEDRSVAEWYTACLAFLRRQFNSEHRKKQENRFHLIPRSILRKALEGTGSVCPSEQSARRISRGG